jgi:uncharacterized iron-regulated protein
MKIKKYFLVLFAAIFFQYCFAQGNSQLDKIREYAKANMPRLYDSSLNYTNLQPGGSLNYLYPLYQLFKQESKFRQIETDNGYYDDLSNALSFLEDYKGSLEYQEKKYEEPDDATMKQINKTVGDLKNIQFADANKYISFLAKSYRVIMINEAHNKPIHRAFVLSLLDDLYKKGFRYLAMEMLNNNPDHSLNRLTSATGFYTNEPVAGELLRAALQLGYKLISYEDTAASLHTASERDAIQAQHISKIISGDTSAKILVLAGYGHIAKRSASNDYVPMAMTFKKIAGIEPLCIDQTAMTEGSELSYGKALYQSYVEKFAISKPSVAMLDNEAINITNDENYDVVIIHPPTAYRDGRPTWLSLNSSRQPIYVNSTVKGAFLVQAYYENETTLNGPGRLIPADQTYVQTNKGNYLLYLRKGRYLVTFRDIGYRLIGKLSIEVN